MKLSSFCVSSYALLLASSIGGGVFVNGSKYNLRTPANVDAVNYPRESPRELQDEPPAGNPDGAGATTDQEVAELAVNASAVEAAEGESASTENVTECVPFGNPPFVETTFTIVNYNSGELDLPFMSSEIEDAFRTAYNNQSGICEQLGAYRQVGLTFVLASESCQENRTDDAVDQIMIGTQLRTNAAERAGIPYSSPVMFSPKGPLMGNVTIRPKTDNCNCAGPEQKPTADEFTALFQALLEERGKASDDSSKLKFTKLSQANIIEGCRPPNGGDVCFNDEGVCLSENATELFVDDTPSPTPAPQAETSTSGSNPAPKPKPKPKPKSKKSKPKPKSKKAAPAPQAKPTTPPPTACQFADSEVIVDMVVPETVGLSTVAMKSVSAAEQIVCGRRRRRGLKTTSQTRKNSNKLVNEILDRTYIETPQGYVDLTPIEQERRLDDERNYRFLQATGGCGFDFFAVCTKASSNNVQYVAACTIDIFEQECGSGADTKGAAEKLKNGIPSPFDEITGYNTNINPKNPTPAPSKAPTPTEAPEPTTPKPSKKPTEPTPAPSKAPTAPKPPTTPAPVDPTNSPAPTESPTKCKTYGQRCSEDHDDCCPGEIENPDDPDDLKLYNLVCIEKGSSGDYFCNLKNSGDKKTLEPTKQPVEPTPKPTRKPRRTKKPTAKPTRAPVPTFAPEVCEDKGYFFSALIIFNKVCAEIFYLEEEDMEASQSENCVAGVLESCETKVSCESRGYDIDVFEEDFMQPDGTGLCAQNFYADETPDPTNSPTDTPAPTTSEPTDEPTTFVPEDTPSASPNANTTDAPVVAPVAPAPTDANTTDAPVVAPVAPAPTDANTTDAPVVAPVAPAPTDANTTDAPVVAPVAPAPTDANTTDAPVVAPVAPAPTDANTTDAPVVAPVAPVAPAPTDANTTDAPTAAPVAPVAPPTPTANTTDAPTVAPVASTDAPNAPTDAPVAPVAPPTPTTNTTDAPTVAPVASTVAPVASTVAPTIAPVASTNAPTVALTVAPVESTANPTVSPTVAPVASTEAPTVPPTVASTRDPTIQPTIGAVSAATDDPTMFPTTSPTREPTTNPPTEFPELDLDDAEIVGGR